MRLSSRGYNSPTPRHADSRQAYEIGADYNDHQAPTPDGHAQVLSKAPNHCAHEICPEHGRGIRGALERTGEHETREENRQRHDQCGPGHAASEWKPQDDIVGKSIDHKNGPYEGSVLPAREVPESA